jgi:uncharacterized protein YbaP (TraB family)
MIVNTNLNDNMYKKLNRFLLFYIIYVAILSFSLRNIHASDATFNPIDTPIFVLQKDGKTIYLLGTKHAARLDAVLNSNVIETLSQSNVLMIEHAIENTPLLFTDQQKQATDQDSLEAALASNGDKEAAIKQFLAKLKGKNIFTNFNVKQANFDYTQLLKYKPWVADLIISVNLGLKAMTQNNGGMEFDLIQKMQSKTQYLETTQEIYDIMDQNKEGNDKYIERIYNSLIIFQPSSVNLKKYLDMIRYNFNGLSNPPLPPMAIQQRNLLWLPKIMEVFGGLGQGQSMVIAVGFGHLCGENGLLPLLAGKGFTVLAMNKSGQIVEIPATRKFY